MKFWLFLVIRGLIYKAFLATLKFESFQISGNRPCLPEPQTTYLFFYYSTPPLVSFVSIDQILITN